jgi:hypothetical protein
MTPPETKERQMNAVTITDGAGAKAVFERMLETLFAENPKCENIALVFAVGGGHEIVFLRYGNQAKAQIADIESRGGESIGGYIYGNGVTVPFAHDTEPELPHFALIDSLVRRIAEEQAGRN